MIYCDCFRRCQVSITIEEGVGCGINGTLEKDI